VEFEMARARPAGSGKKAVMMMKNFEAIVGGHNRPRGRYHSKKGGGGRWVGAEIHQIVELCNERARRARNRSNQLILSQRFAKRSYYKAEIKYGEVMQRMLRSDERRCETYSSCHSRFSPRKSGSEFPKLN
jgi:hypothetical protein